jgi:sporulation protein YlmC with PRC-barrel domain
MYTARKSLYAMLAFVFAVTTMTTMAITALTAAPPKGADGKVGTNPVVRARHIEGMAVKNPEGQDLGKVEDIVVDMGTGRIRYAAVAFGGFLGVGDKLFAVPFHSLKVEYDAKSKTSHFVANIDKKTLENATGFDKKDWPDFADPKFEAGNDRHFPRAVSVTIERK